MDDRKPTHSLKAWRKARKLTQAEVAEYLDYARQTVSLWENTEHLPTSVYRALEHWDCLHPRQGL